MKINYFSRIVSVLLLSLLVTSLSAKDIWLADVANGGDDNNNGLSQSTPVATVTKALSTASGIFASGDVIKVLGIVDITTDVNYVAGTGLSNDALGNRAWLVTIEGVDVAGVKSGFTSGNLSRFSNEIAGYNNAGSGFVFKNLIFQDFGLNTQNNAGVFNFVNNGNAANKMVVENCDFTGIVAQQGAVRVYNTLFEMKNCHFYDNDVRDGGAILSNGNPKAMLFEDCIMEGNDVSIANGKGGAFVLENTGDVTIKNCIMRDNTVTQLGGAIVVIANNKTSGGNMTVSKVIVQDCLITGNYAPDGSVFHLLYNNGANVYPVDITFVNTTIYKNTSNNVGAFFFNEGAENGVINFVNCTITENTCANPGTNFGHGPGMRFLNNADPLRSAAINLTKNIYNSIIEGNVAGNGQVSDISIQGDVDPKLNIRNSYISNIWADQYKAVNDLPDYNNVASFGQGNLELLTYVGLEDDKDGFITLQNCIPLKAASAGLTWGDASYLQALSITTDQIGDNRSFKNGKCAVGSVEYQATLTDIKDDAIKEVAEKVILEQIGSDLYVTLPEGGSAKVDIFAASGSLAKNFAPTKVEAGAATPFALGVLPQGLYIVKANVDGKVYTAKALIK